MNYDIHNPTKGAREIYDGIQDAQKKQKKIHIEPGDTKTDVPLSDSIAEELIERTKGKGKQDSDLLLKPSDNQPKPQLQMPQNGKK